MEMNKKQEKLSKFIETVIKEALHNQMEMIQKKFLEFSEKMDIENKKLEVKITMALEKFSKRMEKMEEKFGQFENIKRDLEEKLQGIQAKEKEVEQKVSQAELNLEMMELRRKRNAIRLRGCSEQGGDLREIMSGILATWTEMEYKDIFSQIENVYRVNSQFAMQKNLPRDIVIYFTNFEMKRKILKAVYGKDLWLKGEVVRIFKEIPRKMLYRRRQFSFLTIELRKRYIVYRWETPNGLSFEYGEKRYYLNTLEKAQDFYDNILGEKIMEKQIKEEGRKGGEEDIEERGKNLIPQVEEERCVMEENREQIETESVDSWEGEFMGDDGKITSKKEIFIEMLKNWKISEMSWEKSEEEQDGVAGGSKDSRDG